MGKILVTGANGLLGQKLVELILNKGEFELIATSRGKLRIPNRDLITYAEMDVTDKNSVESVLVTNRPDVVIHTAAMTNVDQCESERDDCIKLNVEAVRNLVEVCKSTGAFLLHLSTDFIFDGENGPYVEDDKPSPISFYGESKLQAEKIILESGIDWAIVRTVLVYGVTPSMSRSNIILWVKNNLEAGKQIQVVNDQWRSPTLAEDLAIGCYLIAKDKVKGIFNISGEEVLTPYDMALQAAKYFGLDNSLIKEVDGTIFIQPARRPPRTGFVIEKAKRQLGYKPHTFMEGIAIMNDQLEKCI